MKGEDEVKRIIVGTIAAAVAGLLIAVPAWSAHGGDAEPAGVDIVSSNADTFPDGDTSDGFYSIDPDSGTKRAFLRMALAGESLARGIYVVFLYDTENTVIPIGGQIKTGDGSPLLLFEGPDGSGMDVSRAQDDTIYACALTIYRGKVRDLAGYDNRGRCTTATGAMLFVADGPSSGGSGFN